MSPTLSVLASSTAIDTVGTPWLWGGTIVAVLALLILDFALTRRPHEVSVREALGWTAFYIALHVAFGLFLWFNNGGSPALEFFTGYLLEKSLSVDNLFIFMLLLSAFAVPAALAQRVLLYGIAGALVLRGIFIALGAAALATLDWAFLLFGLILLVTAVKLLADALSGHEQDVDIAEMKSVRLLRRFWPVTDDYRGTEMVVTEPDPAEPGRFRRALTPWPWWSPPSWPPTWSSPSTRFPPSTASPATPSWSSPPTPSPCSACAPSTSSCTPPCPAWSTWPTAWPPSSPSSASNWSCTGPTASGPASPKSPRPLRSW
ncbi:putative membrane protein STKORF319 [Nocardia seriolae]|uniref:Membrane protein STKORF319 n=1 Tax=Nocardia seriolae TaxID=37332 RepID=A0ABC9YTX3_9NOCA|nr:putative membrane protein STKORF319 [Nocardia seriolae]GEM27195.1 hypothetical protein NS2_54340 [Nocardia seriolae NBRC 15557]BEK86380.1 hypothetical protein NSERKGN1266_23310 [Nocardia seriolae]BEK97614.1 hypothetical protein NSER024013_55200 [Nocardia seriolae]GAM47006.1 tellurium resistance protein TerC [Nocardia seriolae]